VLVVPAAGEMPIHMTILDCWRGVVDGHMAALVKEDLDRIKRALGQIDGLTQFAEAPATKISRGFSISAVLDYPSTVF